MITTAVDVEIPFDQMTTPPVEPFLDRLKRAMYLAAALSKPDEPCDAICIE